MMDKHYNKEQVATILSSEEIGELWGEGQHFLSSKVQSEDDYKQRQELCQKIETILDREDPYNSPKVLTPENTTICLSLRFLYESVQPAMRAWEKTNQKVQPAVEMTDEVLQDALDFVQREWVRRGKDAGHGCLVHRGELVGVCWIPPHGKRKLVCEYAPRDITFKWVEQCIGQLKAYDYNEGVIHMQERARAVSIRDRPGESTLDTEQPKTWFTSDTHFGSERTLELSRRPFESVREMDQALVEGWNEVVGDNDTVYHLGDFGDTACLKELNGKHILFLPGNYDTEKTIKTLLEDSRVILLSSDPSANVYYQHGRYPQLYMIHAPEDALDPDAFYLFGHIHGTQMIKENGLNVGVDCHSFRPIDENTIWFYRTAIQEHYDRNVFVGRMGNQKGSKEKSVDNNGKEKWSSKHKQNCTRQSRNASLV